MKIQVQLSRSNTVPSVSATKKQQANAKAFFGAKWQTTLTALEAVSKNKLIQHPETETILKWLKESTEEEVLAFAAESTGKKVITAALAFAKNKSFDGKMKALAAIKFKAPVSKAPKASTKSKLPKRVKLTKRGPFKMEIDLYSDMNIDGSFNTSDPETSELVQILEKAGVGIELVELHGPGGGSPLVYMHGTKATLTKYAKNWYGEQEAREMVYLKV